MSKKLTIDDKLTLIASMSRSFEKEQVEHLERIDNVDARYKCAQRYMRELNEGKKGERLKAHEFFKRYREILEGLDCIDNKAWTDEKKIKSFSDLLESYCEKCVKLVEDNNRRHLERLMMQKDQFTKKYEAELIRIDNEIAACQEKLR